MKPPLLGTMRLNSQASTMLTSTHSCKNSIIIRVCQGPFYIFLIFRLINYFSDLVTMLDTIPKWCGLTLRRLAVAGLIMLYVLFILVDTQLCKSENMNPYSTSAKHEWNMDSYFHDCRVVYLIYTTSRVEYGRSKIPYSTILKRNNSEIWDLTSHTPLYSNFSTVKIWTESVVNNQTLLSLL